MPLAVLWMAGAVVSFSAMAIAGREAGRTLPVIDLIFYRGAIALIVVLAVFKAMGKSFASLKTDHLGMHFVRSSVHLLGQATWLAALTLIPLAQLFALEFTAPLWVAVLAPFVLGERLTTTRLLAALIGFLGVLFVVRPGVLPFSIGTAMALTCAIAFAGAMLATKVLTRTEAPLTVLIYMIVMQTVMALLLTGGTPALPFPDVWFWLIVIAVASLGAHFCLVSAFRYGDAIVVSPLDFVRLPLIAAIGIVIYNEPFDAFVLLGGAIIFAATLINIWSEHRSELRR